MIGHRIGLRRLMESQHLLFDTLFQRMIGLAVGLLNVLRQISIWCFEHVGL